MSFMSHVSISVPIGKFSHITLYTQEIYRIKLPGPAILGEGKPENQNHAIIFTRGEGLQTIDMNQVTNFVYIMDKVNLIY